MIALCQTVAIAWLMTRSVLWHVVNILSLSLSVSLTRPLVHIHLYIYFWKRFFSLFTVRLFSLFALHGTKSYRICCVDTCSINFLHRFGCLFASHWCRGWEKGGLRRLKIDGKPSLIHINSSLSICMKFFCLNSRRSWFLLFNYVFNILQVRFHFVIDWVLNDVLMLLFPLPSFNFWVVGRSRKDDSLTIY